MTDEPTTDDRIVQSLRERDKMVLPTTDVAEAAGVTRSTAMNHLRELEAEGRVASDQLHSRTKVWYLPGDPERMTARLHGDDTIFIPTYHEYVRRPVDGRGRATVGSEYAGRHLTFAILESPAVHHVSPDEWEYATPLKWQRTAAIMRDRADDRGRVHLGRDWAEQEVSIAVLEVSD